VVHIERLRGTRPLSRKQTGRPRGRPRLAHAKRRATTRQGRKSGLDPRDEGAPLLIARKMRMTGRPDIEMTAAGVLYGRELISNLDYSKLAEITKIIRNIRAAMGGDLSVAGIWSALIDRSHTRATAQPLLGDHNARDRLERIGRRLGSSRMLALELAGEQTMPGICIRAAQHRLSADDLVTLDALRRDLDTISAPILDGG
jgi:hypothetical protein